MSGEAVSLYSDLLLVAILHCQKPELEASKHRFILVRGHLMT